MQVDPAKILTIANGIEIEKYHNNGGISKYTKRAEIGLNKDDFVIGTIGRLDPIKNHAGLFRSLKEIIPSIKNVKLVVVGDGNIKTKLESLSTSLGIAPHVKLLGNRIDIPQLLSALDIFILPSFSEGFSLALLEAMAAKKPIIASNVGGNKDIIMHEVNGLLVDPNNTYDIASAVLKLYKDPLVRAKLADSAYELVSEKYSIGAMVKHYETIYLGI
jgi:glycosyltransferase involved in cell wall biosynthesis